MGVQRKAHACVQGGPLVRKCTLSAEPPSPLQSSVRTYYKDYSYTLRSLMVERLSKKRGLAIFIEEINGEGVKKWKWADSVMQCLKRGVVNSWGVTLIF